MILKYKKIFNEETNTKFLDKLKRLMNLKEV